jgi:hypothetical protein
MKIAVETGKQVFKVLKSTTGYMDLSPYRSFEEIDWKFQPLPISLYLVNDDTGQAYSLTEEKTLDAKEIPPVEKGRSYRFKDGRYTGKIYFSNDLEADSPKFIPPGVAWHFSNALSLMGSATFKWCELISAFDAYEGVFTTDFCFWVGVAEFSFSTLSPVQKRKVVLALDRYFEPSGFTVVKDYPSRELVVQFNYWVDLSIYCLQDALKRDWELRKLLEILEDMGISPYQIGRVYGFFRAGTEEDWEKVSFSLLKKGFARWYKEK